MTKPDETESQRTPTPSQKYLLEWLARDDGQYGECKGKDLDALMAAGLVDWSTFSRADQPSTSIDYRWIKITDTGRTTLQALKGTE